MANQKISDLIPDDGFVRDEVADPAKGARAGEWYLPASGGASGGSVSNVAGHPATCLQPARGQTRQVSMRPALEKHKQFPKKIPVKRAPTLQIELELPRVREEEVEERERAPEPPGRGIAVVDFYI